MNDAGLPAVDVSAIKLALAARQMRGEAAQALRADPIAIVGMGCRLPGGVDTPDRFWQLLRAATETVGTIPPDRWDAAAWYDPDLAAAGKANVRQGSFLDRIDGFDAAYFGVPPREAERMDPQQRLFLEVVIEALDDAGLPQPVLAGSRTGVFVASYHNDYAQLQFADAETIDLRTLTGTLHSVLANRLSHHLDLRGPSVSIDTACSASLVAVHLACQSLRMGETDIAITGGVSLMIAPELTVAMSKVGFMAPDGRCKTFDAAADGFGRGEGCSVLILKRLSDAIADRDRVLAVVRGSAVNQDGHSTVLAAPNGQAQEALIRAALSAARLTPARIGFVETHGTGTALGDPIEVEAIAATLGRPAADAGACLLGSVKANLGHLEAAAGATGLIKAVLALRHAAVPAQPNFRRLNPHIALDGTRLAIPTALTPWPSGAVPRCASVSSFGVGGTNAHVIVEEAPSLPGPTANAPADAAWLLPLSAKTPAALRTGVESWGTFLDTTSASIADLCHTAARRRTHHPARLAVVGRSKAELRAALAAYPGDVPMPPATTRRPIAFVFSGQGPQWHGMAQELLAGEPVVRDTLERCDALLRPLSGWSLLDELSQPAERSRLDQTSVAQPALFALQVALAALWKSWGVTPDAVVGHSVGEIAALHVAGVLALEDAVRVVWHRGRIMQQATGLGRMAAVAMSEADARMLTADFGDRLSIGAINAPESIVLSGEADALDAAFAILAARNIEHQMLPVRYAFHSAQMESFREPLAAALGAVRTAPPGIAVFSTVTGARADGLPFNAEYFAANMRKPVQFADAIEALHDAGFDAFVEIGPHPVLARSIGESLAPRECAPTVLASLRRGRSQRETMLRACAGLYAMGQDLDWARIAPEEGRVVTLPAYQWQRSRHWIRRPPTGATMQAPRIGDHPLLGRRIAAAGIDARIFEGGFDGAPAWLADHRVFGRLLLPGAAMMELLLAAAAEAMGWGSVGLTGFAVQRPLVLPEPGEPGARWQVVVKPQPAGTVETMLYQATGRPGDADATWLAVGDASSFGGSQAGTYLGATAIYAEFETHGVAFGPSFRRLDRVLVSDGAAEALIELPADLEGAVFYAPHPVLIDAALQLCSVAARQAGEQAIFLPVGADRIDVRPGRYTRLLARAHLSARGTGPVIVADVTIETPQGKPVAAIRGMRFARAEQLAPVADEPDRQDLYTVGWVQAPKLPARPAATFAGSWVVFADAGGTGEAIAAAIEAAGGHCHVVQSGAAFARLSDRRWTIDPADPEHMGRLFRTDAVIEGLAAGGIVHALALDVPAGVPTEPATSDALAVGSVLHLIQSVANLALSAAFPLWLLTRGAQPATADDPADAMRPSAAGLWGLASVAALEHSDLRIRVIDLDPSPDRMEAERLLVNLIGGTEPRLALRGGVGLVPRLQVYSRGATQPIAPAEDRTVRLDLVRPGSIDGLELRPHVRPALRSDEVRVRVLAAALNFRDVLATLEMYPGDAPPIGTECAGIVIETGTAVTTLAPGDRVFGFAPASLGTEVVAPAAFLSIIPEGMHVEDAAGIAVAFLTAQYGLHDLARLQRGERVLIHAAAGGVGLAAVQLAQRRGAEVFATAGSPSKRDFLRSLGVAHVMDSRSLAFADEVMAATDGQGVDVVLNALANDFIPASIRTLAHGGRFLELGKRGIWSAGQVAAVRPDVRYHVYDLGALAQADHRLLPTLYAAILPGFVGGSLRPLPRTVMPLARFAEAFRHMALARHVGRVVLAVAPEASVGTTAAPPMSPAASYWITGGLGAIGLATAEWMARSGARHLVLSGRSAPGADALRRIRALEDLGVTVSRFAVDAADNASMATVLDTITRTLPPLRGVVHAAGTVSDAALINQRWSDGHDVLRGKAHGAWVLHALTAALPLDFFVLYSAAGLVLGAPGQSLYAAANAELDALAHYRRRIGLPALSVAWGAWAGAGMAAAQAERGDNTWTARGLRWIEPEQGFAALSRLLADDVTHGVVLPIDWGRFLAKLPNGADRSFFDAVAPATPSASRPNIRADAVTLPNSLLALPSGLRRQSLVVALRERVLDLLALEAGQPVEVRTPLKELGFDSLMAVELRNVLMRAGGVPLPATLLFDHPTLDALATYLHGAWRLDVDAETTGTAMKDVADLTDDEAEALLAQELAAGPIGRRA
jgi:acyl transferase domain-containing protein/NADPH:quinone reductase-like Zn-dependent oxidoreductase